MPLIPTWGAEADMDLYEFEVSLINRVSSKLGETLP